MFLRLLALFTLVPLAELYVLIALGRRVGLVPTLLLVLFTGVLGAWLARSQGVAAFNKVRTELAAGRLPAAAMVDGLLILLAGAVLLTPGLLTDLAGFFLLVPEGRALVRKSLIGRWRGHVQMTTMRRDADGTVIVTEQYRERRDPAGHLDD
ncbi:MAG: FxsA family protein [Acidobacteriota bacterium]